VDYESWLAEADGDFAWASLAENTAAGLCYTSGTTGEPKGVLYSHRSNVLHAMACATPTCSRCRRWTG
jgi:fatty-acyl-CoA synthase